VTSTTRWAGVSAVAFGVLTLVTWNVVQSPTAAEPNLDGAQLFRAKGCATCHTGPDSTALGSGFPSLADAPQWAADRRAGVTARDYLIESIAAPSVFTSPAYRGGTGPTTQMPQLQLTADEIDALVDYLLGE
jgi:mono/diheme cytochrome c family protein